LFCTAFRVDDVEQWFSTLGVVAPRGVTNHFWKGHN